MAIEAALIKPVVDALMALLSRGEKATLKRNAETALREAESAASLADLEAARIKYLGRNGLLPEVMKGLKDAAPAERPEYGRLANEFKNRVQEIIDGRREIVEGHSPRGAQPTDAPPDREGVGVLLLRDRGP